MWTNRKAINMSDAIAEKKELHVVYGKAGMLGYYAVKALLNSNVPQEEIWDKNIKNLNRKRFITEIEWSNKSYIDRNRYVGYRDSDKNEFDDPILDFETGVSYAVWNCYTRADAERLKDDLKDSFPEFIWSFKFVKQTRSR